MTTRLPLTTANIRAEIERMRTATPPPPQPKHHEPPMDYQQYIREAKQHPYGKCLLDWASAVCAHNTDYLLQEYGSEQVKIQSKTPMGPSSGILGGYTIPVDYAQTIMSSVAERSLFRMAATQIDMKEQELMLPVPDMTTVQGTGVSPFLAGLQLTWNTDGATLPETENTFRQLNLSTKNLSGYGVISKPLWDDPFAFEDWLIKFLTRAISYYEDFAFFQGNGIDQPVGVINSQAALTVTRNTGGHIHFQDVASMLSKMLPGSLDNACWCFSPTCLTDLMQLSDGSNRAALIQIGAADNAGNFQRWQLAGLPAFSTEKLPALGTTGDLVLMDRAWYAIGTRAPNPTAIAFSDQIRFTQNQIVFRVFHRVDGRSMLDNPVTLQDGTTQVSPFVVLK